jgi:hypothetical protein
MQDPQIWGVRNIKHQLGFSLNWKAEETTSTFDDEWDLRWNFNIENKLGVGWHQYSLGYPASFLLETSGKETFFYMSGLMNGS